MNQNGEIENLIVREYTAPTYMGHHINSYKTNLPYDDNEELKAFLKYFQTPSYFVKLNQDTEFRNGLLIEVRGEMIDEEDTKLGITFRESLFHSHDFFEMMYVWRGTCKNQVGDTEMTIHAGEILLYSLQTVHKLTVADDCVVFNILIGKEVFTSSFLDLLDSGNPVSQFYINSLYNIPEDQFMRFDLNENEEIRQCVHDLILEYDRKEYLYENAMRADFSRMLVAMARSLHKHQEEKAIRSDGLDVDDVLKYIRQNYQDCSLQRLSDYYGYSSRSMMRFLKKVTHMTFSEILRSCRMMEAGSLLRGSRLSIDEIAAETGYTERGYFDKVFKQVYHITASEYRRLHQA